MPYVYEVSFDIGPDQMSELEMGSSLQRLVGYLKVRLPGEPGFVVADAVYSVDDPGRMRVVMRSWWSEWEDVLSHRESSLVENKVLEEFKPHIGHDHITVRTYAEVGSGPVSVRR